MYWDSCVWISLLNGDKDRLVNCEEALRRARAGEAEIWTSSLTLAEVIKAKCDGKQLEMEETKDAAFEQFLEQSFVVEVQLGHDIGIVARRLKRAHPVLKKPNDAVHLATAVLNNCDEFHTYDLEDLLPLDGQIKRLDGQTIKICNPPPPIQAVLSLEPEDPPLAADPRTLKGLTEVPGTTKGTMSTPAVAIKPDPSVLDILVSPSHQTSTVLVSYDPLTAPKPEVKK